MNRLWMLILIPCFLLQNSFGQDIVINEIMSSNGSTISDEDGDYPDWFELYNNSGVTINLAGYKITDDIDIPDKWIFPEIELLPDSFLLVFASGKDRLVGPYLHTNFKIDSNGEDLVLTNSDGNIVDHILPVDILEDISFGRKPDAGIDFVYFDFPSPGKSNKYSNSLTFSHERGFYIEPFNLTIGSENSEDQIYFTLDGSVPTSNSELYQEAVNMDYKYDLPNIVSEILTAPDSAHSNGEVYWHSPAGPVDKANIIRVRSYNNSIPTSKIYSHTFFVDSNIYSRYPYPIMSLITDSENLFSQDSGIYVPGVFWDEADPQWTGNYYQSGIEWERDMHFEYFEENGELGFSQNAGVRIHGKQTRRRPQKTFRVYARNEYGKRQFNYQLVPQKELSEYNRFLLTTTYGCWHKTVIKDIMTHDIVRSFNMGIMDFRLVVVFLNGEYWGIQQIRDYQDENYLSSNYGIDKNSIDLLKYHNDVIYGSNESYMELYNYIQNNDLSIPGNYNYVASNIDISNFIDYQITEIYFSNYDWPSSNIKFWKSTDLDNKWRWLFYDIDGGYSDYNRNMLEHATLEGGTQWPNPDWSTLFLRKLLQNDTFKDLFIQRFADLLNTTFQTDSIILKVQEFVDLYGLEMDKHIYRWSFPASIGEWNSNVNWGLFGYAINRPCAMEDHILEFFDLDEFDFICESIIIDTSEGNFNRLFPNPNKGKFAYYLADYPDGNCMVKIMNFNGQVIYTDELKIKENTVYFDTEFLIPGAYILHINSEKFNFTSRFVIVR